MSQSSNSSNSTVVSFAGLFWMCAGAFCSYMINHSIMWALIHAFFGFFYILYLCCGFGGGFGAVEAGIDRTWPSQAPMEFSAPITDEVEVSEPPAVLLDETSE